MYSTKMFLSRIRLWAPSKHAGCSISSGIYVVTAEAETGCPRPPGRFPCWHARDASGGARVLGALQRPGSGTVLAATERRRREEAPMASEYRQIRSQQAHRGWCVHPRARVGCRRCYWLDMGMDGRGLSLYAAAPERRAISAKASAVRRESARHPSAGAGGFTVLDPGKLRLLPGRLPRWPNPWTGPFSGAETHRARGRDRRGEESR